MRQKIQTCSGAFGVGVEISASSLRLNIGSIRLALCWRAGSHIRWPKPKRCCVFIASTCTCPDELTAFAAMMTSPEGAPVVAIGVGYIGPIGERERLVGPV